MLEFLIRQKVSALFVNGTTGEGPLLSLEERRECAALAVKTANERLPVIVQVGVVSVVGSQVFWELWRGRRPVEKSSHRE